VETKSLTVQVTSVDGSPLAGATIQPTGMRSREERGSWHGWGRRPAPGILSGTSDAAGIATITYPAHVRDELTVAVVTATVEHPEYCGAQVEMSVDAPSPIVLARGTQVRLTASSATNIPFIALHADIADDHRQSHTLKWQRAPGSATIVSFLPDGKYMARLVGRTSNGQLYFGAPAIFSAPSAGSLEFAWQLKQGSGFNGKLDDSVPRPVRAGWVVAHVTSPTLVRDACNVLALRWYSTADVAEDGTFHLPYLPEGTLEVIACCDGWVSKDLYERVIDGVRHGQVMPDDRSQPAVLSMERTGDARILVLDPAGQPLADASVNMCPNQSLGRATSIIGARHKSGDILEAKDAGTIDKLRKEFEMPRFFAQTDASGVVVISGLPPGKHRIFVSSRDCDQPIESDHAPLQRGQIRVPRRENWIVITGGEQATTEISMEPKGSTSLSAAITAARKDSMESWNIRCGE
jgi:hypothetical protein